MVNQIKPSDTKSWDIIKHEPTYKQSTALKFTTRPEWFNFYFKDGEWFPIRKPTISEILKDEYH